MEGSSKTGSRRRSSKKITAPIMSEIDLARLGDGVLAYIRTMSSEEAKERFPSVNNLPGGLTLYALHAADGMLLPALALRPWLSSRLATSRPSSVQWYLAMADPTAGFSPRSTAAALARDNAVIA